MVRPGTFQNKQPPLAGKFPPLAWAQKVDHWELFAGNMGRAQPCCVCFGREGGAPRLAPGFAVMGPQCEGVGSRLEHTQLEETQGGLSGGCSCWKGSKDISYLGEWVQEQIKRQLGRGSGRMN